MADLRCPSCSCALPTTAVFCLQCGAAVQHAPGARPDDPVLDTLQRTIGGQYEILRLLGRGGMGAVYLARERALDRLVAIKALPPEATDTDSVERFRREARTAAKLTHPNIVPLHTFGEADGTLYFVMGFVQGESLAERIRRLGVLDPDDARRILAETATALAYAHERGVVHRDIKPDNILIDDETGKPMLTDFGVAKSVATEHTLTQLGTALGTPYYMSPEQAAADPDVDGRSDLYSLGIVGYQMLAGRLPFEGGSIRDVMVQHMTKEPVALSAVAPDVPGDLADAVTRCLAKVPADRVPDGHSLAEAVSQGGSGEWVPGELRELVGDLRPIPWLMAGCGFISYSFALWGHWVGMGGFALIGGLIGLAGADAYRRHAGSKYRWSAILKHVLRRPRWWAAWWPATLRAPDDLWPRLPSAIRHYRMAVAFGTAAVLIAGPVFLRAAFTPSLLWLKTILPSVVLGLGVPTVAAIGAAFFRVGRWARRSEITTREASRLLEAADHDPAWRKPHIQKLLAPPVARRAAVPGAPKTPREYTTALKSAAGRLTGPAAELVARAVGTAGDVLRAIETLDGQIASLARDTDPAERDRLAERVRALAEQRDSESEAGRRMRELLEQQLGLATDLARRLDAAQERRAQLVDLLKTLWLQVAQLKAQQEEALDQAEVSGRIAAITDDARRYVEATDETLRLLKPAP